MKTLRTGILFTSACLWLVVGAPVPAMAAASTADAGIDIVADDIGGVVTSAKGPEAGVWVIAETKDLPKRYIKSVVTDDQGRYVLPLLPKAKYKVWVRGYGLVDSDPVEAAPGSRLDLKAVAAPDAKAAAEYYPADYWYAMLQPPAPGEFPGTGASGNGISPVMLTQQHWLENMKEKCLFCHQIGDKVTRELITSGNSVEAWSERVKMARPGEEGLAQEMQNTVAKLGRPRAFKMLAGWTDAIAAGQTPAVTPPRPSGVERNIVVTVVDWGDDIRLHDQTTSDHRDPNVNAGGPIYGMDTSHGNLQILDPKTLQLTTRPVPGLDGAAHDPHVAVHASEMDGKGRVWMVTTSTSGDEPAWCRDGSVPSSKYYPLNDIMHRKAAQLPVYDPTTKKIENIPLCAGGNHGNFTFDKDSTLWLAGDTQVVAWFNTKIWDETHDPKRASGWCPMVLDTSGDGKIDPDRNHWVQPPIDALSGVRGEEGGNVTEEQKLASEGTKVVAGKDTRISRYLYGMAVAKDGTIWESAYVPYVPSGLVHLIPGKNPPETCKAEYFEPPLKDGKYAAVGIRGVGIDSQDRAWAAFSSGQIGQFDRRKCKVTNGPTAIGQQCPEGWTFYDLPSPHVGNTSATADLAYSEWDDMFDVVGLGKETHFFPMVNSDSITALPDGSSKFVTFRVPYPMGFYTRGLDFRIDDPNGGWKARAMYATTSTALIYHMEGGDSENTKEIMFQLRPNALAH